MNNLFTTKIGDYINLDDNQFNYGVNFVNWFQLHNEQEKTAMDICTNMKLNIIPLFVQLTKHYKDLTERQNENELILDSTKLLDCNQLLSNLLDEFQEKYSNIIKLNPIIDFNQLDHFNGLLSRPDFKNKKWMKIFNLCELTSSKILYSMIAYLDQNLFISSNISLREHNEMADYFLHQNLKKFLSENYKKVNYLILKNKYRHLIRYPFKGLIKLIIKFINFIYFIPTVYYEPLLNTISELLFNLFENELQQLNRTKNLIKNNLDKSINQKINDENLEATEKRCYFVIDQARIMIADFCVFSLKALTGTLFHFWVVKEPLADKDVEILNDYKDIFNGIEDDVYSALHKYLLSTQLRPFGFIMNSVLFDNLPNDYWQKNIRKEMRTWLQECISIFLNWNFKFITIYPRPIQAQYTKMCQISNLYQSMIESLIDFKVIIVLAKQLNNQISKCFYDEKITNLDNKINKKPKFFKINLNPTAQLPLTLINHLENNFLCKEIDLKIKQTKIDDKILPSILIDDDIKIDSDKIDFVDVKIDK